MKDLLSKLDFNLIRSEFLQCTELKYVNVKNRCSNPEEIPSRRKYFSGRYLSITIKSHLRNFTYTTLLTVPSSLGKVRVLEFVRIEIKKKLKYEEWYTEGNTKPVYVANL